MPGQRCTICGNNKTLIHTPVFIESMVILLIEVHGCPDIKEENISVCSRHFPGGNSFETPDITDQLTYMTKLTTRFSMAL